MRLTDDRIDRLRPLVEAETGMDLSGSRLSRLHDAIRRVAEKGRLPQDFDQLLTDPRQHRSFLDQLTSELTIGESFFFRNEHHFAALREHILPEILRENAERREVRIWSAGCAAGEEPYSIAILLDQLLGGVRDDWTVSILGTDINAEFLQRARQAEYRAWSFRRTNIHRDPRYFTRAGDRFRLRSPLRDRVRFAHLNLVKDVFPSAANGTTGLDLILFRNVAIYLQSDVVKAIVSRFHRALRAGGWLLMGEAEVCQVSATGFDVKRLGRGTFFRTLRSGKSAEAPAEAASGWGKRAACNSGQGGSPSAVVGRVEMPPATAASAASELQKPKTLPDVAGRLLERKGTEQYSARCDFAAVEAALAGNCDRRQRAIMRLHYARQLLSLSDIRRADAMLDACLEEDPLMIDGYLLKACLADERGDLNEAESAVRRAIYLDHRCAMAHFQLALVQQRKGDVAGARRSLQRVQQVAQHHDPNDMVEHGDGMCYGRLVELTDSVMRQRRGDS